jgi:Domain of unknown function (DUF4173)
MKKENQQLLLISLLTILHNLFFWKENYGLNIFMFSMVFLSILFFYFQYSINYKTVKISLIGTFITSIFVVIHSSSLVIITHYFCLVILIGFVHQSKIKSIIYAMFTAYGSIFKISNNFKKIVPSKWSLKIGNTFMNLKLIVIPITATIIFFFIYANSNAKFNELSSNFFELLFNWFLRIIDTISFNRIIVFVLAFILIASGIIKSDVVHFLNIEQKKSELLSRLKSKIKRQTGLKPNLQAEMRIAIILVFMVNILLVFVNYVDIKWIWLNFDPKDVQNLSQFVHEGTYLLIFSILLSMGIMLYFFRGNINFYSRNKPLKLLCYFWIFQNIILASSVAIRNYHYIHEKGLAYKRIGVIFFIALTIFGLATLLVKLNKKKSTFYLMKANSWAFYFVIVITSLVDWDIVIASYNLKQKNKIEIDKIFLLNLDDKTLVFLNRNKDIFIGKKNSYLNEYHEIKLDVALKNKTQFFLENYNQKNWLSWNYADYKTFKTLISEKE